MDLWFIFVFILYFIRLSCQKILSKMQAPKRHKKGRIAGCIDSELSIEGF